MEGGGLPAITLFAQSMLCDAHFIYGVEHPSIYRKNSRKLESNLPDQERPGSCTSLSGKRVFRSNGAKILGRCGVIVYTTTSYSLQLSRGHSLRMEELVGVKHSETGIFWKWRPSS